MSIEIPVSLPRGRASWRPQWLTLAAAEAWLPWLGLAGVVALALVLNAWNLSAAGYGNTYYAAAVRSMTQSWHNFFFASFDPGGFISVDKPPVFLWIGAASARIFGYSSWSLLLPSAIAGAGTVALVWLIVRRYAGALAATVAGLALALTPISVAVDRLNLPEPFLILALVGAAWATLRSLESRRWWAWTILAGVLVGVAFNTKMLAAWIPGPALALALVAGDQDGWRLSLRRVAGRLALLAAATFVVSASWMLVVDAWPASDRPYVGGSTDNTVSNLVLDYNGVGRVDGNEAGRPGGGRGGAPANNGGFPGGQAPRTGSNGSNGPTGQGGRPNGAFGQPPNAAGGQGGTTAGRPPVGAANGAGGIIAGSPGWLRMLDDANAPQIAWLLPFALIGSVLALWRWRRDRLLRAVTLLALGWVLLFGGVFSYAQGIYHSYYTSAMAPGIAILVGLAVTAMAGLMRERRWWLLPIAAIVALTAALEYNIAARFPDFQPAARPVAIAALAATAAVVAAIVVYRRQRTLLAAPGFAAVAAALLIIPGSWSLYEAAHPSLNTTLPQAGPREGVAGSSFGSSAFDNGTTALAAWLQAHRDPNARWDLVVTSAQNASTLIADHDLSVMALGGFLGSDPTITVSQFADLVAKGEVRYVLEQGAGAGAFPGGFGGSRTSNTRGAAPAPAQPAGSSATSTRGATAVMTAVRSACTPVSGNDLPAQYQGSLYDCSGAAASLRAAG